MDANNSFPLDPPQQAALAAIVAKPELLQPDKSVIPAELDAVKKTIYPHILEGYSHGGLNE